MQAHLRQGSLLPLLQAVGTPRHDRLHKRPTSTCSVLSLSCQEATQNEAKLSRLQHAVCPCATFKHGETAGAPSLCTQALTACSFPLHSSTSPQHEQLMQLHNTRCSTQASPNLTSPYNSQIGVVAYGLQDPLANCGNILAILFAPQRFGPLRQAHAAHVIPHHSVHKGVPGGCPAPRSSHWWAE